MSWWNPTTWFKPKPKPTPAPSPAPAPSKPDAPLQPGQQGPTRPQPSPNTGGSSSGGGSSGGSSGGGSSNVYIGTPTPSSPSGTYITPVGGVSYQAPAGSVGSILTQLNSPKSGGGSSSGGGGSLGSSTLTGALGVANNAEILGSADVAVGQSQSLQPTPNSLTLSKNEPIQYQNMGFFTSTGLAFSTLGKNIGYNIGAAFSDKPYRWEPVLPYYRYTNWGGRYIETNPNLIGSTSIIKPGTIAPGESPFYSNEEFAKQFQTRIVSTPEGQVLITPNLESNKLTRADVVSNVAGGVTKNLVETAPFIGPVIIGSNQNNYLGTVDLKKDSSGMVIGYTLSEELKPEAKTNLIWSGINTALAGMSISTSIEKSLFNLETSEAISKVTKPMVPGKISELSNDFASVDVFRYSKGKVGVGTAKADTISTTLSYKTGPNTYAFGQESISKVVGETGWRYPWGDQYTAINVVDRSGVGVILPTKSLKEGFAITKINTEINAGTMAFSKSGQALNTVKFSKELEKNMKVTTGVTGDQFYLGKRTLLTPNKAIDKSSALRSLQLDKTGGNINWVAVADDPSNLAFTKIKQYVPDSSIGKITSTGKPTSSFSNTINFPKSTITNQVGNVGISSTLKTTPTINIPTNNIPRMVGGQGDVVSLYTPSRIFTTSWGRTAMPENYFKGNNEAILVNTGKITGGPQSSITDNRITDLSKNNFLNIQSPTPLLKIGENQRVINPSRGSRVTPVLNQNTLVIPMITQREIPSQRLKLGTLTTAATTPNIFTPIKLGLDTPFVPWLPKIGPIGFDSQGIRKIGSQAKRKYTPDYSALISGKIGKKTTGAAKTALGTRPIPKGFKWEFGKFKL